MGQKWRQKSWEDPSLENIGLAQAKPSCPEGCKSPALSGVSAEQLGCRGKAGAHSGPHLKVVAGLPIWTWADVYPFISLIVFTM